MSPLARLSAFSVLIALLCLAPTSAEAQCAGCPPDEFRRWDVNNDGDGGLLDVIEFLEVLVGFEGPIYCNPEVLDVDDNGHITLADGFVTDNPLPCASDPTPGPSLLPPWSPDPGNPRSFGITSALAAPGDTIELTVTGETVVGEEGVTVRLVYDPAVLENVTVELHPNTPPPAAFNYFNSNTDTPGEIWIVRPVKAPLLFGGAGGLPGGPVELFTIQADIRADAPMGASPISFADDDSVFPQRYLYPRPGSVTDGEINVVSDGPCDACPPGQFIRWDVDGNGLSDLTEMIKFLLLLAGNQDPEYCHPDALDADDNGHITIEDAYVHCGSPPAAECIFDPTPGPMLLPAWEPDPGNPLEWSLQSTTAPAGGSIELALSMSNYAETAHGFTVRLVYDPLVLENIVVTESPEYGTSAYFSQNADSGEIWIVSAFGIPYPPSFSCTDLGDPIGDSTSVYLIQADVRADAPAGPSTIDFEDDDSVFPHRYNHPRPGNITPGVVTVTVGDPPFVRADVDADGVFNGIVDGLFLLSYAFVAGSPEPTCLDAADFDDDGVVNGVLDGIGLLNFAFVPGSPPPVSPYPSCGADSTSDALDCLLYNACP